MMSLMDAAKAAYEIARREEMVIVTVAERAPEDGAVAWFAQSIAGVIPIYRGSNAGFEKLAGASVGAELRNPAWHPAKQELPNPMSAAGARLSIR